MDTVVDAYCERVAQAGGIPVHLVRRAPLADLLDRLDGLLIAGGGDVDPRRYGSTPGPHSTDLDPDRDRYEVELILGALDRGLAVLGICRGIQVLNVALGGTLVADLPRDSGQAHSFDRYPAHHPAHRVTVQRGSRVHAMIGESLWVNSFHHQAVAEPGTGVTVVARADDGVVEAIEVAGSDAIGVQWHPEMMREASPLFGWLVERSARRSAPDVFARQGPRAAVPAPG